MTLSHGVVVAALIAWASCDDPDDPEQAADETIHVEFWDGSAWVDRTSNSTYVHNINYSRNPPDVTLTDDCSGLWRIWRADNTTPSEPGGLGRVTFENGLVHSSGITLLVSRNGNALNTMGPPAPSSGSAVVGCHNWDGLTITSSDRDRVRLQAHISGDLRNSVIAGHIHRLDIEGNLRGPAIAAECESSPTVLISSKGDFLDLGDRPIHAIVVGGDVGVEDPCDRPAGWSGVATIDSVEGDITLIEVGGDLYTYVNVPQGTLGALNVAGAIGSPENPASINAKNIGTSETVGVVAASFYVSSIRAMGTGTNNATSNGTITLLRANSGAITLTEGIFAGTLATNGLIRCAGDLLGDILLNNGLPTSGVILVGGTYGASSSDEMTFKGTHDLAGQVVINGTNNSETRVGVMQVGDGTPVTISSDTYSTLPSSLGGGAMGVVPFRVHGAASVPASGSTVLTDPASVTVEYYGRLINLATGGETPMAIRKRAIASPMGDWVTVTSNYNYAVSGRTVTITPKSGHTFDGWFEWEISPVAGELKCANTTAASDAAAADVHTGAFTFSVTPTE